MINLQQVTCFSTHGETKMFLDLQITAFWAFEKRCSSVDFLFIWDIDQKGLLRHCGFCTMESDGQKGAHVQKMACVVIAELFFGVWGDRDG